MELTAPFIDPDTDPADPADPSADARRIVVGIATAGRPEIAAQTVRDLTRQTVQPARVLVSVPAETDFDAASMPPPTRVEVITGQRGLTRQRNAILDRLGPADILLFIDDDFVMAADYLAETARLFDAHPDIVGATGLVAADGINGPGIRVDEARLIVAHLPPPPPETLAPVHNCYGCNMAVRMSVVAAHGIRFDDRLPLYGWLEDVDFGGQVRRHGRIVRSNRLRGVHLGIKSGRQPGVKLGYSQVANPLHLLKRDTIPASTAFRLMGGNLLANTVKTARPEPWVDRRGRLRGNLLAIGDLVRGRLDPARALDLD